MILIHEVVYIQASPCSCVCVCVCVCVKAFQHWLPDDVVVVW